MLLKLLGLIFNKTKSRLKKTQHRKINQLRTTRSTEEIAIMTVLVDKSCKPVWQFKPPYEGLLGRFTFRENSWPTQEWNSRPTATFFSHLRILCDLWCFLSSSATLHSGWPVYHSPAQTKFPTFTVTVMQITSTDHKMARIQSSGFKKLQ